MKLDGTVPVNFHSAFYGAVSPVLLIRAAGEGQRTSPVPRGEARPILAHGWLCAVAFAPHCWHLQSDVLGCCFTSEPQLTGFSLISNLTLT